MNGGDNPGTQHISHSLVSLPLPPPHPLHRSTHLFRRVRQVRNRLHRRNLRPRGFQQGPPCLNIGSLKPHHPRHLAGPAHTIHRITRAKPVIISHAPSPSPFQQACPLVGQAFRLGYIGPPPHPPYYIFPSPFQRAFIPSPPSGNKTATHVIHSSRSSTRAATSAAYTALCNSTTCNYPPFLLVLTLTANAPNLHINI